MMGHPDCMGEWSRLEMEADRRRWRRRLFLATVTLGLSLIVLERARWRVMLGRMPAVERAAMLALLLELASPSPALRDPARVGPDRKSVV